jgi:DNA-directed RNA polymerase specialized sigma24 family protein
MRYTPRAPQELIDGYLQAADLAERRRAQVADADPKEALQWAKIDAYCRMMAQRRWLDAPDRMSSYLIPVDPEIIAVWTAPNQQELLDEILDVLSGISDDEDPRVERLQKLALAAALGALSPTERVIAKLHFGDMWRAEIIMEALGLSKKSVYRAIDRAREKFSQIKAQVA